MQKYYLTAYCLSQGIIEVEGYLRDSGYVTHGTYGHHKLGTDIFESYEDAREKQKERASRAIAAAQKKIKKMEKLLK